MEKYRSFILIVAGLAVALVTSLLTYNWLQSKAEAKIISPLETQEIAVATVDLNWGAALNKDNIKMVHYLKKSLPDGFFTDEASLEGRIMINPVKANEPIFESSLAPVDVKTGGVAAVIDAKKRAMAVKVDKVIGVSGFIYPGHKVDVLVSLQQRKGQKAPVTKTVLENVMVLAVGTKAEKDAKTQTPIQVDVITLEVTPEEAEKLAFAASNGKIVLAMRNFMDTKHVYTKGATEKTLLSSYASNPKKKYRKTATRSYTVEVVRGTDISKVRVKGR